MNSDYSLSHGRREKNTHIQWVGSNIVACSLNEKSNGETIGLFQKYRFVSRRFLCFALSVS